MAAQVTNTVLSVLSANDARDAASRFAFGTNVVRGERYIGEGINSLRATIAAAAAADAFRINPLNVNPLLYTGVTAPVVSLTPGRPYRFSFQGRCSVDGNLVTLRVICRNAAGAVILSLDDNGWDVGGATDVDFGMTPRWQTKAIEFVAPAADDAGGLVDSVIWQLSNGTAGAQLLDLDDFRMGRVDDQYAQ
jgi:hypothetical protein